VVRLRPGQVVEWLHGERCLVHGEVAHEPELNTRPGRGVGWTCRGAPNRTDEGRSRLNRREKVPMVDRKRRSLIDRSVAYYAEHVQLPASLGGRRGVL